MKKSHDSSGWLYDLAREVLDPELHVNVVDLGMIRKISHNPSERSAAVEIALTTLSCPLRSEIQSRLRESLSRSEMIDTVTFTTVEMDQVQKVEAMRRARAAAAERDQSTNIRPQTKIIAVSSGKGGVGKSSLTANLALALASQGGAVGLLDADIWGYSIPRMLGVPPGKLVAQGSSESWKISPNEVDVGTGKLKLVSMGLLASSEDEAIMWRGMMLSRALQHFIEDVEWGDMDYLLIDMPPGTGDIHMTLARLLPSSEILIVTTPAQAASRVAARVGDMSRKSNLRLLGVVENMATFECEHGAHYSIFGHGGGQDAASALEIPLLGSIPLTAELSAANDSEGNLFLRTGSLSPSEQAVRAAFTSLALVVQSQLHEEDSKLMGCTARILSAFDELEESVQL